MIPLREAIAEKHRIAENTVFSQRMVKGDLTKEEYLLYLTQQYYLFEELERKYPPNESLLRINNIKEDITELGVLGDQMVSTKAYVDYLATLDYDSLAPHIYLNYLALIYGGQIIKQNIPGSGKMYDFIEMQAAVGSIRAIQKDEWADEANLGLDHIINIYNELQSYAG
jgi:hypothetical protein